MAHNEQDSTAPPVGCPDHSQGRFGCGPCSTARRRFDRYQQTPAPMTDRQLDGFACVVCGDESAPQVPVRFGPRGQLFKCSLHSDTHEEAPAPAATGNEGTSSQEDILMSNTTARPSAETMKYVDDLQHWYGQGKRALDQMAFSTSTEDGQVSEQWALPSFDGKHDHFIDYSDAEGWRVSVFLPDDNLPSVDFSRWLDEVRTLDAARGFLSALRAVVR